MLRVTPSTPPNSTITFGTPSLYNILFWSLSCRSCRFGPGETEYVVKGFYRDSDTSYPFTFVSPQKRNRGHELSYAEQRELVRSLGCIRIQFARVKKWVNKSKDRPVAFQDAKKRRIDAAADLVDRKGIHVAALPSDRAVLDGASTVDKVAVLKPDVLFECRLFYNDFVGYRRQATVGSAMP